ncbi:ubiquitin-protein ligase [Lithospermum erythrorhizon]|uniref:RING-type E3 ubiquitin transferase n=1 Tax=Lithospermum erythrorhizon TaxID=34254 RepID=A0AAV3NJS2_LITER
MGIFKISLCLDFEPSLKLSPPFLLIIITSTFSFIAQSTPISGNEQDRIDANKSTSPPPEASTSNPTPLKPSIAIFVGFLTIIVCFTFLVLLYAKHCRGGIRYMNNPHVIITPNTYQRQNSGVERSVVESLPTFKFASLRGQKDGLECAVCLNKFEPTEILRLLPKCKHAFHVECLDTWLDIHSTCPLCRHRVAREDIVLVDRSGSSNNSTTSSRLLSGVQTPTPPPPLPPSKQGRKDDGVFLSRHSIGGESGSSSSLEVIVEQPKHVKMKSTNSLLSSSSKRSFDDLRSFNKKHSIINKTTPPTFSSTNLLYSSSESSIDQTRKDRLLLGGRNNNPGKSTLLSGDQENVVEPKTRNHRRGITSLFGNKRSIDGSSFIKKPNIIKKAMSLRLSRSKSLDPCNESSADVRREDELLALAEKHRLQHKIIISGPETDDNGPREGWSDVQESDMLYLQSEMILSDDNNNNRVTGLKGSKSSILRQVKGCSSSDDLKVINERSVSEMTGLNRFRSHEEHERYGNGRSKRQGNNNVGGVISRLKTWIPKPKYESEKPSSSGVDVSASTSSSNVV